MRSSKPAIDQKFIRRALCWASLSALLAGTVFAADAPATAPQGARGAAARGPQTPPPPTPRDADGKPYISWAPGEAKGLWYTDYGTRMPFFVIEDIQFKPWAKGLYDARQLHDLEPHARCKASGAIRQQLTPYGVEILEIPALERAFVFDIGGPHSYREIFMDGRSHPTDMDPTNYGHSIGWWDGDTLVIDSVGYNTDFWFERAGLPHTEAAHVIEYYTRLNHNQMDYRFVLEDETAYDAPVEGHLRLNWRAGEELFEYQCQQSNYAPDLMVNEESGEAIGRTSPIVP